jgi:hypothetical protein
MRGSAPNPIIQQSAFGIGGTLRPDIDRDNSMVNNSVQ